MQAVIRQIRQDDFIKIKELFEDTWNFRKYLPVRQAHEFAVCLAKEMYREGLYVKGVFIDNEPVCLLAGSKAETGTDHVNKIEILLTHPQWQRKGLASILLNGFESWCGKSNHLPIQAISDSDCCWPFYEKKGFKKISSRPVEIEIHKGMLYTFEKGPCKPAQSTPEIPLMHFVSR